MPTRTTKVCLSWYLTDYKFLNIMLHTLLFGNIVLIYNDTRCFFLPGTFLSTPAGAKRSKYTKLNLVQKDRIDRISTIIILWLLVACTTTCDKKWLLHTSYTYIPHNCLATIWCTMIYDMIWCDAMRYTERCRHDPSLSPMLGGNWQNKHRILCAERTKIFGLKANVHPSRR